MKFDNNTALVLEGGGLRGVFTCGVLDCFMNSIPVRYAMEQGYEKLVVILTRNKGYSKTLSSLSRGLRYIYWHK